MLPFRETLLPCPSCRLVSPVVSHGSSPLMSCVVIVSSTRPLRIPDLHIRDAASASGQEQKSGKITKEEVGVWSEVP